MPYAPTQTEAVVVVTSSGTRISGTNHTLLCYAKTRNRLVSGERSVNASDAIIPALVSMLIGLAWPLLRPLTPFQQAAEHGHSRAQAQLGFSYQLGEGVPENWTEAAKWCRKSAEQFDRLGLYCLGQMYQFGIGVPQDRERAYKLFDRAEDQGDGQSKFFAQWLRVKDNCIGYRNEKEREIFLFICDEPKGTAFANSHERNMWLSKKKNEFEAANIHPMDDYGKGACGASGGTWGGGGCNGEGGRRFDPSQQDRYGRPLW